MNPFRGGGETPLDPNKLSLQDMLAYRGAEYRHFARLRQNAWLSRRFLLGTLLGCAAATVAARAAARRHVFGADGKGGELLAVRSRNSLDDELYSRAFQTMMYLAEPTAVAPESLEPQRRALAAFGVAAEPAQPQPLAKRAPHPKYL